MKKTVEFKKPVRDAAKAADAWVTERAMPAAPSEPMKRFTIDVPKSLHTRIKTQCSKREKKMADVLREILEKEFPAS